MKKTVLIVFALLAQVAAMAEVKLPQLFQNGMVLQRDKDIPVWGTASAGEKVRVVFRKKVYETTADAAGHWQVTLPPQKAGGPYTLEVRSEELGAGSLVLSDVLIGDVWLCSGQSNIDVTVERVYPQYHELIDDYANDRIRMFRVLTDYDTHGPKTDVKPTPINWRPVTRDNAWLFSAVGYFLGREMYERTGVPQGVIVNSLGGSPIQAWLPADTLRQHFPAEYARTLYYGDDAMVSAMQQANRLAQSRWQQLLTDSDPGLAGGWARSDYDDSQWAVKSAFITQPDGRQKRMNLTDGPQHCGTLWARQTVEVDAAHAAEACQLLVGTIYDSDQTYVNGQLVGQTGYQYPPRRYTIPAGLLREGRNVIAVRITTQTGAPHFIPEKPYKLIFTDGTEVALGSHWRVHEGASVPPCPSIDAGGQNLPSVLYNAMLCPLAPYALQGVVWYQGESNTGDDACHYETWLTQLVTSWRQLWQSPGLPFVIVQLANFMEPSALPQETGWGTVREAQRRVAEKLPSTELACIIDLGETVDIHPLRKREVALRVADCFCHTLWNPQVLLSPRVVSAEASGRQVVLTLDQPLRSDGPLFEFEVAAADGRFVSAEATAQGREIVVQSPVEHPQQVRYAWKNNPLRANAFGKTGLPMSPFAYTVY